MPKTEIKNILAEIKKQADSQSENSIKTIKNEAKKQNIDVDSAVEIYEQLVDFYKKVEEKGGIEKYIHSDLSWMKIELELLYSCYQLAISHDMKVLDVSEMLSLNDLHIFPKTPSQLQNTYYKLKKELITFEDIVKSKPGRKRKPKASSNAQGKTNIFGRAVSTEPATSMREKISFNKNKEKNLFDLLSGVKSNVQLLSEQQGEDNNVYDLLKSIYSLSSLAVQKEELDRKYQELLAKNKELEQENFQLRQENENNAETYQILLQDLGSFLYATELEQIQALPLFTQETIVKLNQLGFSRNNQEHV
ncbi:DNA-binding domain-containing protein [Listeria grayi]|uniref:Motility protein repressor MogR n=1 Tax=Listeria grayi DSM 20601 TaxID=525367 RepID=D7V0C4_LISGR|nr:DNA-binding domain-containing protein [Listeria grayi]EFI83017.1 motility protein repressor MogR [Listeria grayi DSM 20601]